MIGCGVLAKRGVKVDSMDFGLITWKMELPFPEREKTAEETFFVFVFFFFF